VIPIKQKVLSFEEFALLLKVYHTQAVDLIEFKRESEHLIMKSNDLRFSVDFYLLAPYVQTILVFVLVRKGDSDFSQQAKKVAETGCE
jgi:hypothetical protein